MEWEHKLNEIEKRMLKAESLANSALNKVESHEVICELRYENINTKLDKLDAYGDALRDIYKSINRAYGAIKALTILSVAVGVLGAVIAIVYRVMGGAL